MAVSVTPLQGGSTRVLWVHAHPLQGNDGRSASRHPCRGRLRDLRQFCMQFCMCNFVFLLESSRSSSYYGSYGWWGSSEHSVSNSIDIAIMISGYNVWYRYIAIDIGYVHPIIDTGWSSPIDNHISQLISISILISIDSVRLYQ